MADKTQNFGSAQFAMGEMPVNALREQLLQGKGQEAMLGALGEALDLYSFMSTLPDALIASQQRELQRVAKREGEKGPRIGAMRASIAQAKQLDATFKSGRARFDRALSSVLEPNEVFHGFVSGPTLQMQKGYTVRLIGADGKQRHSAVTQDDGYFSLTLKVNEPGKSSPIGTQPDPQTALLAGMLQFVGLRGTATGDPVKAPAGVSNRGAAASAVDANAELASVEIVDPRGEVVQQDPVPIALAGGTVYREYVVAGTQGDTTPRRYIGNSASFEVHDSEKLTRQCHVDAIRESRKVYFASPAEAQQEGYDFCAYCFDKKLSKR